MSSDELLRASVMVVELLGTRKNFGLMESTHDDVLFCWSDDEIDLYDTAVRALISQLGAVGPNISVRRATVNG